MHFAKERASEQTNNELFQLDTWLKGTQMANARERGNELFR